MSSPIDVVEFELGGELYALDINLAREIVEMMPITPIPRSADYISGIINLRGEITNIVNLAKLLKLPEKAAENRNIIVLTDAYSKGSKIGIIVDSVHSVMQISEEDVEQINESMASDLNTYVKGIIKVGGKSGFSEQHGNYSSLIIWLELARILEELIIMTKYNGTSTAGMAL